MLYLEDVCAPNNTQNIHYSTGRSQTQRRPVSNFHFNAFAHIWPIIFDLDLIYGRAKERQIQRRSRRATNLEVGICLYRTGHSGDALQASVEEAKTNRTWARASDSGWFGSGMLASWVPQWVVRNRLSWELQNMVARARFTVTQGSIEHWHFIEKTLFNLALDLIV